MSSSTVPEGPLSATGAPHLPEGFTGTVDTLAADPGALHASFAIYRARGTTIAQNQQRESRRLAVPVLAIGHDAASSPRLAGHSASPQARPIGQCHCRTAKCGRGSRKERSMSTNSNPLADRDGPPSVTRFDGVRVPATDYRPVWLDSLADDVTLEGSAMDGVVTGAEAVRTIVAYIRTLYEHQQFNFAGPYGENGFLEDYTAEVCGKPIGNVVLVTRNAAGQAQHIVANYRPRTTLLLFSRLMGEHFAGTTYGGHFATGALERGTIAAETTTRDQASTNSSTNSRLGPGRAG